MAQVATDRRIRYGRAPRPSSRRAPTDRVGRSWRDGIIAGGALAVMLASTALIEALRLGGTSTGGVSDEVFTWFTPAGYVFSIWAVIYVGLAAWCVRLARTSTGEERFAGLPLSGACALFVISCALNVAWLVLWHLRVMAGSVALIALLLLAASVLYRAARRRGEGPMGWVPLSVYASWLLVASVANIAHAMTRAAGGHASVAPAVSTALLLVGVLVISYLVKLRMHDPVYPVPVIWAGIGVGVRLMGVSVPAGVVSIALTVLGAAAIYIPRRSPRRGGLR